MSPSRHLVLDAWQVSSRRLLKRTEHLAHQCGCPLLSSRLREVIHPFCGARLQLGLSRGEKKFPQTRAPRGNTQQQRMRCAMPPRFASGAHRAAAVQDCPHHEDHEQLELYADRLTLELQERRIWQLRCVEQTRSKAPPLQKRSCEQNFTCEYRRQHALRQAEETHRLPSCCCGGIQRRTLHHVSIAVPRELVRAADKVEGARNLCTRQTAPVPLHSRSTRLKQQELRGRETGCLRERPQPCATLRDSAEFP